MCNNRDYFRKELCFKDEESRDRFVQMYEDLFCSTKSGFTYNMYVKKIGYWDDRLHEWVYTDRYPALVCFLKTEDWGNIIKNLDIKAVRRGHIGVYKVCFN